MSKILMQDLGIKHGLAKFVPQLLLLEQKEHRAAVANDLIQTTTNELDFLKKAITRAEWRVYDYGQETKAHSFQGKSPGSPCPKKAWQRCKKIETMLTDF